MMNQLDEKFGIKLSSRAKTDLITGKEWNSQ